MIKEILQKPAPSAVKGRGGFFSQGDNKMKKNRSFKMILLLVCASITSIVHAANVPNTLNYQGTITDSTGKPVTATAKPVTFKLYTTALGGTAFWTEPQTVQIANGQFSVVLGSTVALPTAKFTGDTYVGVTVDGSTEMLPRQKLTSVAYALKAADAIPKGVIVMWSSVAGSMPEGWALCDGSTKTALDGSTIVMPDLRNKFIMGAGGSNAIGVTGGASTHTHTGANHLHYDDHIHTGNTNEVSGETHTVDDTSRNDRDVAGNNHYHAFQTNSKATQGYGAYTGLADRDLTTSPESTVPPFYALAFIMKL